MSRRTEQIGQMIAKIIADIIQHELADPGIAGVVSITHVKVSPDIRQATVFFSVLGDELCWESTELALNRAKYFIQRIVGQRLLIKTTPRLTFKPDRTMEKAAKIEQILENERERENRL